nr:hypothetical protein [uncultured Albidiferax sp.]
MNTLKFAAAALFALAFTVTISAFAGEEESPQPPVYATASSLAFG